MIKTKKVIELCSKGCCPVVELDEDAVKIGEEGNLCVLRKEEWAALKAKILSGEL